FDGAKAVLARVPNLIDPEKVSTTGIDDADPHVIALAVYLKNEGEDVTIITEDVNSTPKNTRLADAAGVFKIPCVRFRTFLVTEGIWDGREGTGVLSHGGEYGDVRGIPITTAPKWSNLPESLTT